MINLIRIFSYWLACISGHQITPNKLELLSCEMGVIYFYDDGVSVLHIGRMQKEFTRRSKAVTYCNENNIDAEMLAG